MGIYIFCIFFFLITGLLMRGNKKVFLLLCFGMMFFVSVVRSVEVGADTLGYVKCYSFFEEHSGFSSFTTEVPWTIDFEPGYMLLMKICGFFHCSERVFLAVVALLIYIPFYFFYRKYSVMPLVSIIIFFCLELFEYSLGIFRQMISIGILLFSVKYLLKNENIKFLILVLVAFLFHKTSAIFLPMLLLSKKKFSNKIFIIFICLEAFFFVLSGPIIGLMLKLMPSYSSYVGSVYGETGGSYRFLIMLNAIFIVCSLTRKYVPQKYIKLYDLCLYAIGLAILLQIVSYRFVVLGRMNCYLLPFIGILIPIFIRSVSLSKTDVVIAGGLVISFFAIYFCISVSSSTYIYPFSFYA